MNRRFSHIALVLAGTMFTTAVTCVAGQPEKTTNDEDTEISTEFLTEEPTKVSEESTINEYFFDNYIKDHLQIGIRSAYRVLTDDDSGHRGGVYGSGTYLGTIYGLDEEQNAAPMLINMTYFFNKYLGIELAYDRIEAETAAIDSVTLLEKTDGDVILAGPTISLIGQYRNSTNFIPYAGVGFGLYFGSFDADSEWTLSSEYNGAAYNHMEIDNVFGLLITAGTKWLLLNNWALDLSVQYVKVDPDATYTGYYYGQKYTTQTGHFPMDNVALRLGVVYNF